MSLMEGKLPVATYTDFEPRYEWLRGGESDTLLIDVTGFTKEQLKVLISTSGSLKISGARPLDGNQWVRFLKEFHVPKHINVKDIQAKFDKEEGLLYLVLPKAAHQDKPEGQSSQAQAQEMPAGPKATTDEARLESERAAKHAEGVGYGVADVVKGLSKRKLLVASVVVAVVVIGGIGIYLRYNVGVPRE